MVERADVVLIGGGPAGLSAAGALKRLGHDAVVLERDPHVGARWESRYDRLHLHTVRSFSGLAHVPIPRAYGRYPSKDAYAQYLRDYVAELGLDVRTGVDVTGVRPCCGRWELEAAGTTWCARAVVLATGRYDEPVLPEWAGRSDYRGRLLHSAEYRNPGEFAGRSVLVVGLGNSGAEIAGDLAHDGVASVTVAVRTPPPITPRDVLGVPIHLFGLALAGFPPAAVDRAGAVMRRVRVGDLRKYGLGNPAWGPFVFKRPPVIDVGFLDALIRGRIRVRPAVTRLTPTGAVFADGTEEPFDAVVAATGYRTAELADASAPGVFRIGYRESVRGALFEINRDSRTLAREIATYLERPAPTLS
jgi:cation diffusion facilitator CzcD-associated flavoprotein CzcO